MTLPGFAAELAGLLAVQTAWTLTRPPVAMVCGWLCSLCRLAPAPPRMLTAAEQQQAEIRELIRQSLVDLPHAVTRCGAAHKCDDVMMSLCFACRLASPCIRF